MSNRRNENNFRKPTAIGANPILVLGAGPAGLSFAQRYGRGCKVLERSSTVGGLSQSILIDEGVFDIGGHSFHTPYPEVRELVKELMGDNWHQQTRDARVCIKRTLIPYPFQHHFNQLPDVEIIKACEGHIHDPEHVASSHHFEAWIYNRFGTGIAEHFMLPYNRKLWARDLKEISCEWVRERVATEIISNPEVNSSKNRTPLLPDSQIGYPRDGGFGEIFNRMAKRCEHIEFNQDVVSIDINRKIVTTKNGNIWNYDSLVSTLPLPLLLKSIKNCSPELLALANELQAVPLKVIMLLVALKSNNVPHRIYSADPKVPAHKIAFNHTSSPSLLNRKNHAVMCEISYSATKPVETDLMLTTKMIDWLIEQGFIADKKDILNSQVVDVPFGYPVNTHDKQRVLNEINQFLTPHGIHSIGRFGAWEYANSDACIWQGIQLADQLINTI